MTHEHFWVNVVFGFEGYDECIICKEKRKA